MLFSFEFMCFYVRNAKRCASERVRLQCWFRYLRARWITRAVRAKSSRLRGLHERLSSSVHRRGLTRRVLATWIALFAVRKTTQIQGLLLSEIDLEEEEEQEETASVEASLNAGQQASSSTASSPAVSPFKRKPNKHHTNTANGTNNKGSSNTSKFSPQKVKPKPGEMTFDALMASMSLSSPSKTSRPKPWMVSTPQLTHQLTEAARVIKDYMQQHESQGNSSSGEHGAYEHEADLTHGTTILHLPPIQQVGMMQYSATVPDLRSLSLPLHMNHQQANGISKATKRTKLVLESRRLAALRQKRDSQHVFQSAAFNTKLFQLRQTGVCVFGDAQDLLHLTSEERAFLITNCETMMIQGLGDNMKQGPNGSGVSIRQLLSGFKGSKLILCGGELTVSEGLQMLLLLSQPLLVQNDHGSLFDDNTSIHSLGSQSHLPPPPKKHVSIHFDSITLPPAFVFAMLSSLDIKVHFIYFSLYVLKLV